MTERKQLLSSPGRSSTGTRNPSPGPKVGSEGRRPSTGASCQACVTPQETPSLSPLLKSASLTAT